MRKSQRASRYYAAEDDEKWAAWQRRVRGAPADAAQGAEDAAPSAPRLYGSLQTPRDILVPVDRSTRSDRMAGLDREPKTSLPYNEHKFVPSLRQALQAAEARRAESAARKRPSAPAPVGNIFSSDSEKQPDCGGQFTGTHLVAFVEGK